MKNVDVVVIGGGAAGLMCAATAGKRGRSVLVLDHANKVGKKILMSGGGRCNFTNLYVGPENYLSSNPHFCKSALSRYSQWDFIELVSRYQIAYHEKTLGQLFCDNKANDILNMLLAECEQAGVTIQTACSIDAVTQFPNNQGFHLLTTIGELSCSSLVVATGGLSIPTMGASGFGYKLAEQFGLAVTEKAAALVPFTLSGKWLDLCQPLSGISLPVIVSCRGMVFKEAMLFTHRGLSGPAILQISNYWQLGDPVEVNFLPDINLQVVVEQWRAEGNKQELKNLMAQYLPKRFVNTWLQFAAVAGVVSNKAMTQFSNDDIQRLVQLFQTWQITPSGTEGYRTAEVTRGGVNTDEISSKTFAAKKVPGLYFIGEVLDVTGWLGGFNFQWAWASGYCAGTHV